MSLGYHLDGVVVGARGNDGGILKSRDVDDEGFGGFLRQRTVDDRPQTPPMIQQERENRVVRKHGLVQLGRAKALDGKNDTYGGFHLQGDALIDRLF